MLAEDRPVGSIERLLILKKAPHIGTLAPELLATLAEAARPRVFRRGQFLMREGERLDASYFVVEGRVHLVRGGQVLGHAESGAALGGLGILARALAPMTASADRDTLTLELDADTLLEQLEDHSGIMRHFLREITGGIIDGWQRLPPGTPPPIRVGRPGSGAVERDLDLVDRIFYLRQVAVFAGASINALAELARGLTEIHLSPGMRLWSEGEEARHAVLIVTGGVEGASQGGFQVSAGPGVPLGALEAIAGRPRFYDAVVTHPLTGFTSEIEVLFDVFEDNLDMALEFLTVMSQWLMVIAAQLAELSPSGPGTLPGLDGTLLGSAEELDEDAPPA